MYTRDAKFYDVVGKGLASLGYTGKDALHNYINEMFADKYNAQATFAQEGFGINPNIPINPTYEQLEATIRPYTMAGYVDIDSDGPTKSTDGMSLKMGGLPTFKHEITLSRKILREKMLLMDVLGGTNADIEATVLDLLFNGVDDLIGGNYNTMLYQRHQVVSNHGKLVINATNNPLGTPLEINFNVPAKNKTTSVWYTKNDTAVSEAENVTNGTINPIQVLKGVKLNAEQKDLAPRGHWEVNKTTWDDILALPFFRKLWAVWTYPNIDAASQEMYGKLADDDTIKAFIETRIGAKIRVVDSISTVEKFNKATGKMEYTTLQSFNEGVMVYVPDGEIGDVQFGKPIFMETPGARTALYDGGRTLIRQVFNDENMIQTIKSEVTGLVVPNKVRWMYYVTIKG